MAKTGGKMSHKKWKALKRKQKRQEEALRKCAAEGVQSASESEDEAALAAAAADQQRQHQLWLEREKLAQIEWEAKKERERKELEKKLQMEQQIREEWEERQKKEKEEEEEREKNEKEKKEKQEKLLQQATAHENKESWHNPLAPTVYGKERDGCPFFLKTGACRFGERCSRYHPKPESSTTLLFPGMFANFRLEQSLVDENDTDLAIEYDDSELYQNFKEFYDDVLPELRAIGRVVQFKVSSNCEPHLRGNVYVQYKREEDTQRAFMQFNGRWYGGKRLSCEFVKIDKWKSAICGLAFVKRCPKGRSCNFLHVFKNPGNEFWQADKDMSERDHSPRSERRDGYRDRRHHYSSRRRYDRRNESRSSYRSRSRSRSPSQRSRSPRERRYRRDYNSKRSRSRSRSRSRKVKRRSSRSLSRSRSRSPRSDKRTRRSKSHSRSRSRSKSRRHKVKRSRCRSRSLSRSRSRSMSNSRFVSHTNRKMSQKPANPNKVNGQSSHSNEGKFDDGIASESGSEMDSKFVTSGRKKDSKHKKHKHKHKHKKQKKKSKNSDSSDTNNEEPKPNVIEIPRDDEVDISDVVFEDVYV